MVNSPNKGKVSAALQDLIANLKKRVNTYIWGARRLILHEFILARSRNLNPYTFQ